MIEDVPRLAAVERTVGLAVVLLDQVVDRRRIVLQTDRVADPAEDPPVLDHRRIGDLDLVADPAQEGLVNKVLRLEVGGGDEHLGERDHHGGAGPADVEVVEPRLQRDDKAVEQVLGTELLAAEVVHQEEPTVGLQLERGLKESHPWVEAQFQLTAGQLAPSPDYRAGTERPASVVGGQVSRDRTMVHGVEDPDHLALHVEGMGNEDGVAEQRGASLGDAALAVPGWAVQEDRLARPEGRAQTIENAGRQHEMVQGCPQHLVGDRVAAPALVPGHGDVDVQRHRRRARVLVDLDQLLGPLPARPADYVLQPIGEVGSADRASDPRGGDIAFVGEELERVTHDIPGQADMAGGFPTQHGAVEVDDLEHQIVDEASWDASFLGTLGYGRESDLGPLGG